jgi:hypothetical protein
MGARFRLVATATATVAAVWLAPGCGSSGVNSDMGFSPSGGESPSPPPSSNGAGAGTPTIGADGGLPPETKSEGAYQSPVSTGHVVWIANPQSGRVAYIDAATLDVKTIAAGDGPTYLAAVPDAKDDVAIVLNVRSHDATLLRDAAGALSTKSFPVTNDANSWAVSTSGAWAIAWADATRVTSPDPTQGFQDVAVLDTTGAHPPTILAVGYRPVKLAFAADGSHAFAVTADGISVIDLTGTAPVVTKNFAIADSAGDAGGGAEDVSITGDGAYALVRRDGSSVINVVALADGTRTPVSLPASATDLTLSPDGKFALAVLRDTAQVALLPIPAIASAPSAFTTINVAGETVGRAIVNRDAKSALLFTTAAPVDHLVVLDLGAPSTFRAINLHAPVLAVFPSDDARFAVVLHQVDPTASVHGAFSVVPVADDLPAKIVGVSAAPNGVAIAPTSDRALISIRDDARSIYGFYLAKMPSLEVDPFVVASPPIAAGIAASAGRGYIAQDYSDGRITFVQLGTGQAQTITGFELGARVVDGSQP